MLPINKKRVERERYLVTFGHREVQTLRSLRARLLLFSFPVFIFIYKIVILFSVFKYLYRKQRTKSCFLLFSVQILGNRKQIENKVIIL